MDKPECDSAYERLLAMLTACAQGAALSAGPVPSRVQSLDFMVKGLPRNWLPKACPINSIKLRGMLRG